MLAGGLEFITVGVVAGLLVGCVGIGGVIIVPVLAYVFGLPIKTAIPAASATYIVSGVVGTWSYAAAGLVPWKTAAPLLLCSMPAAILGAVAAGAAPIGMLELAIGLLAAVSGIHALQTSQSAAAAEAERSDSRPLLGGIGAATGFGSALTGTGGPLILVPVLIGLEYPVIQAVGMAQVIQLPIAVLATLTNAWADVIEPVLTVLLATGLAFGTWAGARIAQALPRATLRRVVATVLVLTGGGILLKVGMRAFA